ncbi:MAG: type III pantothenate kinase [Thermaerobacter sp.]|nr:type III pantothenate kinase [Thermaerobacter sp.]
MADLIAIDIGNTHIKLGVYGAGRWIQEWRLSTDARRTADEYQLGLRGLLAQAGVKKSRRAVIASVVPLLTPIFLRVAETVSDTPPLEIVPPGYGLTVQYNPPESLGADRFVNALAAWTLVGEAIVVDAGTTVTVDAVTAEGKFLGGAIAPGPHFLVQALATGTAKLPLIAPTIPEFSLGQRTQDAIAVGIGHGFVGMVNELISQTNAITGGQATIVLTGGWAGRLAPFVRWPVRLEPQLTLEGLRFAVEWRSKETYRKAGDGDGGSRNRTHSRGSHRVSLD